MDSGQRARIEEPVDTGKDYGLYCQQPNLLQDLFDQEKNRIQRVIKNSSIQERDKIEKTMQRPFGEATWALQRKFRLTASNFCKVCRMRDTTSCTTNINSILHGKGLRGLRAVKHSIELEPTAIAEYKRKLLILKVKQLHI